jgi:hypothetical protein
MRVLFTSLASLAALMIAVAGCGSNQQNSFVPLSAPAFEKPTSKGALALYVLSYGTPASAAPESIDEYPLSVPGPARLSATAHYGKGLFGPSPAISAISAFAVDAKVGLVISGLKGGGAVSSYYRFAPGSQGSMNKLFSPNISAKKGVWPTGLTFDADHDLVEGDPSPDTALVTYSGTTSKQRATLPGVSFYPGLLAVSFDAASDSFVSASNAVNEFAPFAVSTSAPTRSIPQPSGLTVGIAVDSRGNVYTLTVSPPIVQLTITSPSNTVVHILGPATRLDLGPGGTNYAGPVVDSSGRIYVARYDVALCTCTGGIVTVLVFSPTAKTNAKPIAAFATSTVTTDSFLLAPAL